MRIGLDVSMLGGGGGIATYAECLLGALARQGGHSLTLWCGSRSGLPEVRRLAPAGSQIVAPGMPGRVLARFGRLAAGNRTRIESFVGRVDVFHGPNYLLPAQRG